MILVKAAWIALLRWLSFGWWERERNRIRTEEARSAERWVNLQRARWIAEGYGNGVLDTDRKYRFGLWNGGSK